MRNHLVALRPSRPKPATIRFEREAPNDLWQIDATEVVLASAKKVWIMDILDDHARFYLAARVVSGPTGEAAWAVGLMLLSRMLYRVGLRRYSAYGG